MSKKIDLMVFSYSEAYLKKYIYLMHKDNVKFNVYNKENYLFFRQKNNDAKVLIDCHLDVVYNWNKTGNDRVYITDDKRYLWSPYGIGGDDRAGVHIALWLMNSKVSKYCDFVFTNSEESGCIGASVFNNDWKGKVNYLALIGLDREGRDFVVYHYYDSEWIKFIEKVTNRKMSIGSYSDIAEFEFGVCGVNLGIGYYNNHRGSAEYVSIEDMLRCYSDAKKLIEEIVKVDKKWVYTAYKTYGKEFIKSYRGVCSACGISNVDTFISKDYKDYSEYCFSCLNEFYGEAIRFESVLGQEIVYPLFKDVCNYCGEIVQCTYDYDFGVMCFKCLSEVRTKEYSKIIYNAKAVYKVIV